MKKISLAILIGALALLSACSSSKEIKELVETAQINGQSNVTFTNEALTEATGIAYCTATLVNEVNGKDIGTTNYVRYSDDYVKQGGKWYIKKRRTTFITSDTFELNTARVERNNSDESKQSSEKQSENNDSINNNQE